MIFPKYIKEGSLIGVPAPSDGADDVQDVNRYRNAKIKLEDLGYRIKMSNNIFNSDKARSASAQDRAYELNEMFADKDIDLILCACGGEFLIEMLPYVDFDKLVQNPKLVEGFSDPTGLLFPITTKYDIATIYGNNFSSFGMENYHKSLDDNLEILKGNLVKQNSYELYESSRAERITGLEDYNLDKKVFWRILGNEKEIEFDGRVFAGCLDLIDILAGTKYDGAVDFSEKYKDDGIIWCFDNCDLSKEQLIRTLWKLNELGYFANTTGLVFGRCGNDNSYVGYDMESALKDSVVSKLDIPIVFEADISHKGPSFTIVNGAMAKVCVGNGKGCLYSYI